MFILGCKDNAVQGFFNTEATEKYGGSSVFLCGLCVEKISAEIKA